jgi:DmsE family decaheme c-type cytochrome
MRRAAAGVVIAGAFVLAATVAGAGATQESKGPPPVAVDKAAADTATVDTAACLTCHDAAATGMKSTPHASLEKSCVSCHEASKAAEHMAGQMEGNNVPGPSLKKLTAANVDATCLQCHDKGHQANFAGGVHERRNVSCASCHSVHMPKSTKAQLKMATQSETCFSCHQTIRGKSLRTSHHPVREGKMECSSCHEPHDSTSPKMVNAAYVNEKCLECHTEKRGPFLWEHSPVRENCLNCHDPHGSNHDKMLVAKQPFLCQRCHLNTRHPGTLYDARNSTAGATVTSVSNRAAEHSCRNCHIAVHGSNAPSGAYLGR